MIGLVRFILVVGCLGWLARWVGSYRVKVGEPQLLLLLLLLMLLCSILLLSLVDPVVSELLLSILFIPLLPCCCLGSGPPGLQCCQAHFSHRDDLLLRPVRPVVAQGSNPGVGEFNGVE